MEWLKIAVDAAVIVMDIILIVALVRRWKK